MKSYPNLKWSDFPEFDQFKLESSKLPKKSQPKDSPPYKNRRHGIFSLSIPLHLPDSEMEETHKTFELDTIAHAIAHLSESNSILRSVNDTESSEINLLKQKKKKKKEKGVGG